MANEKSSTLTGRQIPANGQATNSARIGVMKTYKLYIDGRFPRTESGRYDIFSDAGGKAIANVCRASRKDFRDAVLASRKAQSGWAGRSAYNKGQILYRIAEMLEGRRSQFIEELGLEGLDAAAAGAEVSAAVDRLIYYAGWSDKYQQVFSAVNPVESSHFNFSLPEPTGVVSMIAPATNGLLGLVTVIAPAIVGGNTVVVLAAERHPLTAITFAEVLHTSDLPGGVVNILTGQVSELAAHFSSHMDVNAVVYCGEDVSYRKTLQENASLNVKRPCFYPADCAAESAQSPYRIMDLQEVKTTWHPIGQ
jgi:acyl-CoA reductase-like NAD-dependent aldehyde dehydrogenase